MRRIFFVIILALLLGAIFLMVNKKAVSPSLPLGLINNNQNIQITSSTPFEQMDGWLADEPVSSTPIEINKNIEPISGALARVTKKPFGIKISPSDSPVDPEKFSGYHTGVDFETTEAEQNMAVPIYTICAGKLLVKKQATGYGGVVVQACEINKQAVTVVYGHLQLASVTGKINQELKAGERLGLLGQGYSPETDGERKHLHLSVHVGTQIILLGYVSEQAQLSSWLDPLKLELF